MDKFLFVDVKGWKYNIHFHRTAVTIELQQKVGWFHWKTVDSQVCSPALVHATIRGLDQYNAWRLADVR